MPSYSPPIVRFWKFVNKSGPIHPIHGQCWEWIGGLDSSRYGSFQLAPGKPTRSHRFSYSIYCGRELDKSEFVCHRCDNRKCVRPEHLFLSDPDGNMKDMVSKGRQNRPKGSRNPRAILTEEDAIAIKATYKRRHPEFGSMPLAKKYGVARVTILKITSGIAWKHI